MARIITPTGTIERPIKPTIIDNIKKIKCPHDTIGCDKKDPDTGLCMIGNCDQKKCGPNCEKTDWCDLKW